MTAQQAQSISLIIAGTLVLIALVMILVIRNSSKDIKKPKEAKPARGQRKDVRKEEKELANNPPAPVQTFWNNAPSVAQQSHLPQPVPIQTPNVPPPTHLAQPPPAPSTPPQPPAGFTPESFVAPNSVQPTKGSNWFDDNDDDFTIKF